MTIVFVDSTHKNATMLMADYKSSVHLGKVVDDICKPDNGQLRKVVDDAGGVFHKTVVWIIRQRKLKIPRLENWISAARLKLTNCWFWNLITVVISFFLRQKFVMIFSSCYLVRFDSTIILKVHLFKNL